MKLLFSITTSLLLITACREVVKPKKERPVQIDTMILVAPPDSPTIKISNNAASILTHDTTTYIRFQDCHFSLDWIRANNQRNNLESRPDTLYFYLMYNHTIEGQMLAITTDAAKNIKVWQRYETSIFFEGILFAGWKHFTSNWEQLTPEVQNFFICKTYTTNERKLFPPTSLQSFKQYVKNSATPIIYEKAAALKHLPETIGISRYYLRLEGLSSNKLLIFDVTTD
ncbi:hypothetical protein DVR12_09910 [Chitinophaga silvatica]|uniref:Lipoprotein n=1 Tax=Chitinophaga silvatica TaxID=2282649 RepID=A0A3E1YB85_9BACT|nr:hypothetical protein [Chitinophaga silvatica]RFS23323.1 hypothetical protein DVR12_09910 [Chitinophaga silvatica]